MSQRNLNMHQRKSENAYQRPSDNKLHKVRAPGPASRPLSNGRTAHGRHKTTLVKYRLARKDVLMWVEESMEEVQNAMLPDQTLQKQFFKVGQDPREKYDKLLRNLSKFNENKIYEAFLGYQQQVDLAESN